MPQHEEHWFETYGKIALTGQPARFQNRAEQLHRWYDVYAFRFGQPENRQVAIFFNDITEGKRAEAELRESEERFRGTFENAAVGIANVGAQGEWLRVNQKLCDIVGYTREELLQRTFQSITHPEDLGADMAQFARLLRGEIDSYELEKRYLHKQGRVVWIHLTVAARRDQGGHLLYRISVVQDISNRKQAQQELQRAREQLERANADLERRVDERTAALREAMAEMEQMSYSMIHDMRAPLRAIQSFGGILEEDPQSQLSEEGRDLLAKMRTAANRMDHLVVDVLNYSKVVRGELPLEPVDVGALTRGIVETYPDFHPPRAEVSVAPDLPVVAGERGGADPVFIEPAGKRGEVCQTGAGAEDPGQERAEGMMVGCALWWRMMGLEYRRSCRARSSGCSSSWPMPPRAPEWAWPSSERRPSGWADAWGWNRNRAGAELWSWQRSTSATPGGGSALRPSKLELVSSLFALRVVLRTHPPPA